MLAWAALIAGSICAFGVLGAALGIFQLGRVVKAGLNAVAEVFYLTDDDEEEEDFVKPLPMDDVGYEIDDDTDEAFIEIAKQLGDLERDGNEEIAGREESA